MSVGGTVEKVPDGVHLSFNYDFTKVTRRQAAGVRLAEAKQNCEAAAREAEKALTAGGTNVNPDGLKKDLSDMLAIINGLMPDFWDSPYYDRKNCKVKDDAPEDVKKKLRKQIDDWNKEYNDALK